MNIRPAIQESDLHDRKRVSKADAKRIMGVDEESFIRLWQLRLISSINRVKSDEVLTVCRRLRSGWTIPRVAKARAAHLYVIEIVNCCVKVGISRRPLERLRQHADHAAVLGRSVGRAWVSIPHAEARANEMALQGDSRREYLTRDFERVLEQALSLPMTRVEVFRGR